LPEDSVEVLVDRTELWWNLVARFAALLVPPVWFAVLGLHSPPALGRLQGLQGQC